MIITLTPNTGVDHTIRVPSFPLNCTLRAVESAWGMGGKATDVSWILGKLGIPNRALGFAAGPNGVRMEAMLRERGVETDFVWVEGETRLNTVIVVGEDGQSTITSSSLSVSPQHLVDLMARYGEALRSASCVVVGGSLPAGVSAEFFVEAIAQAHRHSVPVIFDSSGPSLVAGIQSRPDLIKPNLAELQELLGTEPASRQAIGEAAMDLRDKYGVNVIVTIGGEGAVAVFDSASYFIHPLVTPVASVAGAGDGVLAGMALSYLRREPPEYGLRHGFALATAILKTLATADFLVEDYEAMIPQICITPLH
jgi:1-phosphofructokinase